MTPLEQEYNSKCICGDPDCQIPFGFCHCRCGQKTALAKSTSARWHAVKGMPQRFISCHSSWRRPVWLEPKPFKLGESYCCLVPLNRGLHVVVDASDYEWAMQWRWHAKPMRDKSIFYAARTGISSRGETGTIWMHRELLGLFHKSDGIFFGDHKNHVTTDNRRINLRIVTRFQSAQNRRTQKSNTSGFKGVGFSKEWQKWFANITFEGQRIFLGYFDAYEEAVAAYCEAADTLHGEFACYGQ